MLRIQTFSIALCLAVTLKAAAQASFPAPETIAISARTMSQALAGCRTTYERFQEGTSVPIVKTVVGASGYEKDITSLNHAEKIVNFLIAHPGKVTGVGLVAVLSSSDDFFAGVGSTRLAILSTLVKTPAGVVPPNADDLMVSSTSLADCQTALFNAGDIFVDVVLRYVAAEDEAIAATAEKVQPNAKP